MTTTNKNVITIGGSENYLDIEEGFSLIDASLKKHKINKKNLMIYAYAPTQKDTREKGGAQLIAEKWAEKYKLELVVGNPNPQKHNGDWKAALDARNKFLAEKSKLLINFSKASKNGGEGIIKEFQALGKPVEKVGEVKEDTQV